ncbi:MAG: phosphoserine phosphatase SerB [Pseudomonadota bacterium]
MADTTPHTVYMLIVVAPVERGFVSLSAEADQRIEQARLTPTGTWRLLGNQERWVAIEREVTLKADLATARAKLRTAVSDQIDIALLPAQGRRKALVISDMDSTIIEQECLDELAHYAGLKDEIAAITARAMAGELDFDSALTERVGKLKGLSLEMLEACYHERITLMPGAKTMVATMVSNSAHAMLVSGGFTYFTARVADAAGFQTHQGNTLIDDGSALTGAVAQPILGRSAKRQALLAAASAKQIDLKDTLAMGDGANDLAMIEAAGLGLAVHAKPIVADAADAAIQATDLTSVLYYQGYSDSEIVWR